MIQAPVCPLSLSVFFRKQALKWAGIGFALTVLLALPCFLCTAKIASERALLTTARSAARAFRPMIVEQNSVRDAEFQIQRALELQPGESAVVRDPELRAVYPLTTDDEHPRCHAADTYCWSKGFRSVSLLYPIYFDEDRRGKLYGYLEITLRPIIDWTMLSLLGFVVLFGFVIQAYGLSSALRGCAQAVTDRLTLWSKCLTLTSKRSVSDMATVPFVEFYPMHEAVQSLQIEISRLEKRVAQEAKDKAQASILREIGHDMKTPLSQLGKFLLIHFEESAPQASSTRRRLQESIGY